MSKNRIERLTFRLDEETRRALEEIAEREDLPISAVIRRAVRMYLNYAFTFTEEMSRKERAFREVGI